MDEIDLDQKSLAKNSVLRFLSYRPRSIYEVSLYLQKKEYSKQIIEHVIEELTEAGFLNDHQFASWLTDSRIRTGPAGPIKIAAELRNKGISKEIIQEATHKNWGEIIHLAWTKNADKLALLPPRQKIQKLQNLLTRQGFSYQQIGRLVDSLRLSGYNISGE